MPPLPLRHWTTAALLVPVLLLLGGCGASSRPGAVGEGEQVPGSLSTDTVDQTVSDAQDAVARRSNATPEEIFDVGAPQELDVGPDGSLITAWQASAGTGGEGPVQRAWRVLDADGRQVAQGRMSETSGVLAVADGFLVLNVRFDRLYGVVHVDAAGGRSPVEVSDRRGFPRRGDTFVPDLGVYYRPSSRTLAESSVAPEVRQDGVAAGRNAALSDTGLLYQYADPPRSPLPLGVTGDGGRRWRYTQVPVGAWRPSLVAAHGDDVVVVLSSRTSSFVIAALAVSEDAGRTWQRTDLPAGMPDGAYVDHLRTGADGRAVLGAYGTGWWRALPDEPTSYEQLPVPDDGVSDVRAAQDRLFAMSATGIWRSDDDGEQWTRVDTGA